MIDPVVRASNATHLHCELYLPWRGSEAISAGVARIVREKKDIQDYN